MIYRVVWGFESERATTQMRLTGEIAGCDTPFFFDRKSPRQSGMDGALGGVDLSGETGLAMISRASRTN